MRKLATIQQILDIQPIINADAIEAVTINGWKVVAKKGEFKIGDLCVFFEIDSFLPIKPEFEFLRKGCYRKLVDGSEGFRLKTVRLRGQLSQGLALPLSAILRNGEILNDRRVDIIVKEVTGTRFTLADDRLTIKVADSNSLTSDLYGLALSLLVQDKLGLTVRRKCNNTNDKVVKGITLRSANKQVKATISNDNIIGLDLSDLLEVKKYEPPMPAHLQGFARGSFPSYIRKTDQMRIQNFWHEAREKYNDIDFEVTLKLDGTSSTYYYNNGEVGVCSRNLNLKCEEEDLIDVGGSSVRNKSTYISVGVRQGIFDLLKRLERNIAIQGEIIGEGIQGNSEKCIGQQLYVFDIWDIDQARYLTADERLQILSPELRDSHIHILEFRKLSDFENLDELLKYAEGRSINAEVREGVVFKSKELVNGETISFKVISNQFLLNEK